MAIVTEAMVIDVSSSTILSVLPDAQLTATPHHLILVSAIHFQRYHQTVVSHTYYCSAATSLTFGRITDSVMSSTLCWLSFYSITLKSHGVIFPDKADDLVVGTYKRSTFR